MSPYFERLAAAAAIPAPAPPQYEYPDEDTNAKQEVMLSHMQFLFLGCILGVVATLIYY